MMNLDETIKKKKLFNQVYYEQKTTSYHLDPHCN